MGGAKAIPIGLRPEYGAEIDGLMMGIARFQHSLSKSQPQFWHFFTKRAL